MSESSDVEPQPPFQRCYDIPPCTDEGVIRVRGTDGKLACAKHYVIGLRLNASERKILTDYLNDTKVKG